jgi:hypothetical protein
MNKVKIRNEMYLHRVITGHRKDHGFHSEEELWRNWSTC